MNRIHETSTTYTPSKTLDLTQGMTIISLSFPDHTVRLFISVFSFSSVNVFEGVYSDEQIASKDELASLLDNTKTSVEVSDCSPGIIDLKEKKRKPPISLRRNKDEKWEDSCAKIIKLESGPHKISLVKNNSICHTLACTKKMEDEGVEQTVDNSLSHKFASVVKIEEAALARSSSEGVRWIGDGQ